MSVREDVQPNEAGRRGHHVPSVVAVSSFKPPPFQRAGWAFRGTRGLNRGGRPPQPFPRASPQRHNTERAFNGQGSRQGNALGSFPNPAKRPRLDSGPPRIHFNPTRPPPSGAYQRAHAPRLPPPRPPVPHRPPQIVEPAQTNDSGRRTSKHNLPLPQNCRIKAPGSKRSRRIWLSEQRRELMNKNYTITNEFIDYTQGVVRWTVELPADSSDRTSIENNAHRDALNHPSTVQVPAHKPPPIPVASSPTTKSYAEPSGMDADDPIVVTAMDEYLLIPAARPTSLFNIDSSIPSEQTEDRDEPDVNASPAEGARPPSPFLPLLPGGADCRDPVRPPSSGAEPLVGPSYISDTARPSSPPRTSEALLATQWHDLSYFLKRPPQRQFVSGALSIDPPLCPGKGKQRADVGPDVNARCIQHAPSASADDTTPVIRRPRDEDDSSSEEEPLSRKPRSRPAAVNPPVILPGIHYDISKRSSSPAADDEIISIADSSDAEESSLHHALLCPQDGIIRIESHQQRDKPRRLLMRGDPGGTIGASGLYTVSMHGVVNHVYADPLRFSHTLLKMDDKTDTQMIDRHNSIDDACVLSDGTDEHFVFGHKNGSPELCVARVRDQKLVEYRSLQQVRSRKGVSAVCALPQPLTFATGGYDHSIHLWQLDRTLSCSPRILSVIRHASTVQALLPLHDKSSKLITAGADSVVNVYDLPSERVINTFKASVSVYHLHPTSFASCALLEVGHLEQQWEIRDLRKVPDRPVVRFGYTAGETHGRYMKGSAHAHLFAGGDTKGNVRLWDVRKTTKPLSVVEGLPGQKVSQVTFRNSSQLVVCSEANYLRVLDLQ